MSNPIINQPWEDVADDVTSAIEKAVQPLLKRAVDDIYSGLLNATQDYLRDNLAFNIASQISSAEREAASDRRALDEIKSHVTHLLYAIDHGYFGEDVGLRESAFVEPLRAYAEPSFTPIEAAA